MQLDKHPLDFDVLTDRGNHYADALGIRYELPDYLAQLYEKFGLNLPVFHDDSSWALPLPARLVADKKGIVRFSEAKADYTYRPEPTETLEILRALVKT